VDPGPFFYIANYYLFPLYTLNPFFQQTGEIDNIIVSWDKVLDFVVCRFHVAAGVKLRPGQVIWRYCPELSQS
jgi:hypothetical protein